MQTKPPISLLILIFLSLNFVSLTEGLQQSNGRQFVLKRRSPVDVATKWEILEPLPLGDYGSDVTEAMEGGIFRNLGTAALRSEMADGALARWRTINVTIDHQNYENEETVKISASINVKSATLSEKINADYYGIGGLAWRGWAIAEFRLTETMPLIVQVLGGGVRYFYIDNWDTVLAADPYQSGLTQWSSRMFTKGLHRVFIPFSAYGAENSFQFRIASVEHPQVVIAGNDVLLPDIVDGSLASPHIGVVIVNQQHSTARNLKIVIKDDGNRIIASSLIAELLPGQVLPVPLRLLKEKLSISSNCTQLLANIQLLSTEKTVLSALKIGLRCRTFQQPYRFTFLDADKTVHKASVFPPQQECPAHGCPVIFTTHGASVECDSDAWTLAYRQQKHAWILLPSNRRNYGYDWEGPGFMNGLMALKYFSKYLPGAKPAYTADTSRLLFAGHSMGGHGCLIYSTLLSDYAVGFACASGWLRREMYIPSSSFAVSASWTLPGIEEEFKKAGSMYAPDQLITNVQNIPALMRVGSQDDVVPAWGLRRIARMLDDLNGQANFTVMSEIPNQGHWFDGIVDDDVIQAFFDRILTANTDRPSLPRKFEVRFARASSYAGRCGLRVMKQLLPWKTSILEVERFGDDEYWSVFPQNVKEFALVPVPGVPSPQEIFLGGQRFQIRSDNRKLSFIFTHDPKLLKWDMRMVFDHADWLSRDLMRLSMFEAITTRPLMIVCPANDKRCTNEAVYISNVLYYQGRHAVQIVDTSFPYMDADCTLLLIGNDIVRESHLSLGPFHLSNKQSFSFKDRLYDGVHFAALLRMNAPGSNRQIISVIGNSEVAMYRVLRQFLPVTSAMKTPDFVIVDTAKSASRGLGGVVAAGMIDE